MSNILIFYKTYCILILFVIITVNSVAQKQSNNWVFGHQAGIKFHADGSISNFNSAFIGVQECSAVISDQNGDLLFYTNGISVWNKNHELMPNGFGLKGGESSTQGALIVQKPLSDSLYYLFTVGQQVQEGFYFHIIDINADGGLGDVIQKNIFLYEPVAEKLEAIKHANGQDIWIIVHGAEDDFRTYLLTSAGLSNPVISRTGPFHDLSSIEVNAIGYMRASRNQRLIATAIRHKGIDLFSFDNSTGAIQFKMSIFTNLDYYYGIEFSPDNSKLYFTASITQTDEIHKKIYQVDFNLLSESEIINSVYTLGSGSYGALLLAPDNKIYATGGIFPRNNSRVPNLSIIENPNDIGENVKIIDNAFYLAGNASRTGLPNFPKFQIPIHDFFVETACLGESTQFRLASSLDVSGVLWDFGDGGSSTAFYPTHTYTSIGVYTVSLTITKNGSTSTSSKTIDIQALPVFDIGDDMDVCTIDTVTLSSNTADLDYLWQNYFTGQSFDVSDSGRYWVEARKGSCLRTDTINVDINVPYAFSFGADSTLCDGDSLLLNLPENLDGFSWNITHDTDSLYIFSNGTFSANTNRGTCIASDEIDIKFRPIPVIELGDDLSLCYGDPLILDGSFPNAFTIWNDSIEVAELEVNESGVYKVKLNILQCTYEDNIQVNFSFCQDNLFIPNAFSPNGDSYNEAFEINGIGGEGWRLVVFDRNSQTIFSSANYKNDWIGAGVAAGAYYYFLENKILGKQFKGIVHVLK